MRFEKYHALGNDYLVLDPTHQPAFFSPEQVCAICHRHFGLGSDGILYGPHPSKSADYRLEIWNPDGSEAEKSGNGLRIFARFLRDTGRAGVRPFTVETPGGVVRCTVHSADRIEVEMGGVTFDAAKIPVHGVSGDCVNQTMSIAGVESTWCAASIGNPHVVLPMEEISADLAREIGPVIENDTVRFPNRTNVQLLKVIDRSQIQIEIWERGAGYTLASGSSSSAAAAVAHRLDLCDANVTVHCPGGDIAINILPGFQITMTGPATRVGTFEMDRCVPLQKIVSLPGS